MKISYDAWKAFKECPKKFFLEFIKKAPPTTESHDYYRLYGLLTQKFFEVYCNIWRARSAYIPPDNIREKMLPLWEGLLASTDVNWAAPYVSMNQQELFDKVCQDVSIIMDSLNQNYFLNTKSEVSIELKLKEGHVIDGRLDFIHTEYLSGNSVVIFDGKGTSKIGKNVSNDQLYFYALLYFFSTKILPSSLGFFYYQLNTFAPVFFNKDVLNEFRAKLSLDIKTMTTTPEYIPTPCAKSCRYCLYLVGCEEGLRAKAKRAKPSKLPGLEGDGVVEFGF